MCVSVKSAITVTVEGVFKGTVLNLIVQQTNSVLVLENLSASARRDSKETDKRSAEVDRHHEYIPFFAHCVTSRLLVVSVVRCGGNSVQIW